jgi:branched-chain amino acid transport system substrate-binding protein
MRSIGLALLLALVAAASARAEDLTIYSSLPLSGSVAGDGRDVLLGERLALEQAGGRAGPFTVRLVSLDDVDTRFSDTWDPGQVSANARRAVEDDTTIAYLGEYSSGASAISLPITNEGGILMVSPTNTYVGLTRSSGEPGDPDKFYPAGNRTYGRVAPADHRQARALAAYLQALGAHRAYLVDDLEVYGTLLRRMVRSRLRDRGIRFGGLAHLRRGRNAESIADRIRRSRADAMVYLGITHNGAPRLWRAVHRRAPRVRLLGADGVATRSFTRRLSRGERARTYLTDAPLTRDAYPPAGQAFFAAFGARYGRAPRPRAIYGYEAMSVVLDSIARAGPQGNVRPAVVSQFFATRNRDSVLGRYSIDRFGDTTLPFSGGYKVSPSGEPVFARILDSG